MTYISPAPFALRNVVGCVEDYFIHAGYTSRTEVPHFDDTPFTNEFQREVYQYARQVLDGNSYAKVLDMGCGSGYKLLEFFEEFDTLGIDVPVTVQYLRQTYPKRQWMEADWCHVPLFAPDILTCSDVIEHLLHPDLLLRYIVDSKPKRIVLSTPARCQLNHGTDYGPPHNIHHVREWSYAEFHAYADTWLHIRDHFIVNGIQVVDAELKEKLW